MKGASGAGKTTVAALLAQRLGVPHIELDALHHGPNWAEPTNEEFQRRVQQAMQNASEGWVIDGNYERKLGTLVTDAADTVLWIDLPLWVILPRLWQRTSHRIRNNVELWNGNREAWKTAFWGRESLFVWAIRSHRRHRREWPLTFRRHPGFVRLRSSADVRRWLAEHT
ncbi:MAG: AAA family ATPase [Chloroflexi bacterium]|nr:AAA family ATPase [Chloroflexota bacterium]